MKQCELYQYGIAFYDEYKGDTEIVLCPIQKGTCSYNNEGEKIKCQDGRYRTICTSKGLVQEVGLITKSKKTLLQELEDFNEINPVARSTGRIPQ